MNTVLMLREKAIENIESYCDTTKENPIHVRYSLLKEQTFDDLKEDSLEFYRVFYNRTVQLLNKK